jgi:hypothetical protein
MDTQIPYGIMDLADMGYFGTQYPSPPKPYTDSTRLLDFNDSGTLEMNDWAFFGAHYHDSPYPQINNAPSELAASNAGVTLEFTEEFPTATTHRLYVDVGVESFTDVSLSVFSMRSGSDRLSFVEWLPAESTLGDVLFAPVVRDGVEEYFYGLMVSEAFTGTSSQLGRLSSTSQGPSRWKSRTTASYSPSEMCWWRGAPKARSRHKCEEFSLVPWTPQ